MSNDTGIIYSDVNSNVMFTVDAQNRRIGINTAFPTVPFEVTGNAKITGNLEVTGDLAVDDLAIDDAVIDQATITTLITSSAITNSANVGTANTGVTAVERGDGRQHQTVLTFTNLAVGSATGAANLAFGKLLYTLPAGVQNYKVAYMNVTLTGAAGIVADTPDVGIGTVIGSGAVAVLGGTATFEDIITGQTSGAIDGTNAIIANDNTVDLFRNTADAKTVHLNVADGWAAAGAVTATGTIVLEWSTIV